MDGVITVFSKYRDALTPCLVAPDYETNEITRSKYKTLKMFEGIMPTPTLYENDEEIDLRQSFDNDDVGFVSDDKAFQQVNDAEESGEFMIDEDSEDNDIFIRAFEDDDDFGMDEEMGVEDFGLDFETSEEDYN